VATGVAVGATAIAGGIIAVQAAAAGVSAVASAPAASAEAAVAVAATGEAGYLAEQELAESGAAEDLACKVGSAVGGMTQAEQRAVTKIGNIIEDHLQPSDISGAVSDALGNPIFSRGRYWNHLQEVIDALRGWRNQVDALEGVDDPAAQAAQRRALDAIAEVEDAFKGLGI
jgi:hypothetical protein